MKNKIILIIFVLLLNAFMIADAFSEESIKPENLYPQDTTIYIKVDNIKNLIRNYNLSKVKRITGLQSTKLFLNKYYEEIVAFDKYFEKCSGIKFSKMDSIFNKHFSYVKFDTLKNKNCFLFTFEISKEKETIEWSAKNIKSIAESIGGQYFEGNFKNAKISFITDDQKNERLGYVIYGNYIYYYFNQGTKEFLLNQISTINEDTHRALSKNTNYKNMMTKFQSSAICLYVNTNRLIEPKQKLMLRTVMPVLYIENIKAVGGDIKLEKNDIIENIYVLTEKPEDGLFSLLEGATPDKKILKFIPDNVLSVSYGRVNLPKLWLFSKLIMQTIMPNRAGRKALPHDKIDNILDPQNEEGINNNKDDEDSDVKNAVDKANEKSELNLEALLKSFDGDYFFALLPGTVTPNPYFVFKIKNQDNINKFIDSVRDSFEENSEVEFKNDDSIKYFITGNRFLPDIGFHFEGEYLLIAPVETIKMIKSNSYKPITSKELYIENEKFYDKNSSNNLYVDLFKFGPILYNFIPLIQLKAQNKNLPYDFDNFPARKEIIPLLSIMQGYFVRKEDGYQVKFKSPLGVHFTTYGAYSYVTDSFFKEYLRIMKLVKTAETDMPKETAN